MNALEKKIVELTEREHKKELKKLDKDMVFPMMIVRRCIRNTCIDNDIIGRLNDKMWVNVCNYLYNKYVK